MTTQLCQDSYVQSFEWFCVSRFLDMSLRHKTQYCFMRNFSQQLLVKVLSLWLMVKILPVNKQQKSRMVKAFQQDVQRLTYAGVAQQVAQVPCKHQVVSSNLTISSISPPWCKGSTAVCGTVSLGSIPSVRTLKFEIFLNFVYNIYIKLRKKYIAEQRRGSLSGSLPEDRGFESHLCPQDDGL